MKRFAICTVAEKVPDGGSWTIMVGLGYAASHIVLVELSTGKVYHANGKKVCQDITFIELLVDHAVIDYVEFNAPVTDEEFQDWWKPIDGRRYSNRQFGGFVFSWTFFLKNLFKDTFMLVKKAVA
jgi:hypothetical protein